MDTEFEATFIDVDKSGIRDILSRAGAVLKKPEFLMKRVVFNLPAGHSIEGGWLRVRDEGDRMTMSLKIINGDKIEDQKEICLEIDNFDRAVSFLEIIGCRKKAFQESRREVWTLDGVEISLDEWPFLEPFIEIEGTDAASVRNICSKLGFDFEQALFCSVDKLYSRKYGLSPTVINHTPEIVFTGQNPFLGLSEID